MALALALLSLSELLLESIGRLRPALLRLRVLLPRLLELLLELVTVSLTVA